MTTTTADKGEQEFKREERYIVIKLSDFDNTYLAGDEIVTFHRVLEKVAKQRNQFGKSPLECAVIESDWPEYEPVWKMIEDRMAGRPTNEGQDGLTDSEILTDAHRYCCKYVHADDAPYRFTERGIIEFVRLRVERALNQRQAVKAEPAIEALSMIGEVLGLDEDDAGPTPIIDKIVCLQEAFETVKRLHLIATNQVVDLRKAVKPEPISATQGVPEETYVLFGYATGKFLERIVPPAQGKLINDAVALYAKADFSQMNAAAPEQAESKEGKS